MSHETLSAQPKESNMAGLMMKYFVLKPHGDDAYAKASRAAMRSYANSIREENPELCKELREWADNETSFPEMEIPST